MTRWQALHDRLGRSLRDPVGLASLTGKEGRVDPRLVEFRSTGGFWKTLYRLRIRLFVSREYEHLLVSLAAPGGRPDITSFPLPHPSGIAVDAGTGGIHVVSSRNPNALVEFRPASCGLLVPARARFLPGRLYLHDLTWIAGRLHGTAAGENALVRLDYDEPPQRVWWPKSIESRGKPDFSRNVLQLNSVAAGPTVAESFYTASCAEPGVPPPGDPAFQVDGLGVILSGKTRRPLVAGLTRPHSLRRYGGRLWVNNSGYGELLSVRRTVTARVVRLPGWTRGLCKVGGVLFVGTSRVLHRFRSYAPGLQPEECMCGIHAIEASTGRLLGSVEWPWGNQIFAIEAAPQESSRGFPSPLSAASLRQLFHTF
jgi:uncharacterized protein (TIGR03032 family)